MVWQLTTDTAHDFGAVFVEKVQIEGLSYRVDDTAAPRDDGIYFGQDFADPGDIILNVAIQAPHMDDLARRLYVRDEAAKFTRLWDAADTRDSAGDVAELSAGEFGTYEGRPRGVVWDFENYAVGFVRGTARFIRSNMMHFPPASEGGGWQEATLQLIPAQTGGLMAPLVEPLRTAYAQVRASALHVAGDAPAHPIIELHGPIQADAMVEVVGRWRLYMNRPLGQYDVARIDTRPGRLATYLNDRPVQIIDPRSSLLVECSLMPGENVASLRGASIEGTASVVFRWRNTKGSI